MADHNPNHTPPPQPPREGGSSAPMAFIVGGLVIAVAIIAWIIFGAADGADTAGGEGASDVNVSVETSDDAAEGVADAANDAADAVEGAAEDVEGAAENVEGAADNVETETQQ
ncbi:MAG: hypothetical protein ACE369_05065 [Roseovarius sp.]